MTEDNSHDINKIELFEAALKQNDLDPVSWIRQQTHVALSIREGALELLKFDDGGPKLLLTGQAATENETDIPVPDHIGDYKVISLIGQGGMGAVYRGSRDKGDFQHDVAIKLIKPTALSQSLIERFERERQILADFNHPNIARLYDGGTTDQGAPFFIMELIDGLPIIAWADQNNLDVGDRLSLFVSACEAIGYAHRNLIIHRDITPNNVLVTQEGVVKLIDFGIAKTNVKGDELPSENSGNSLASFSFTPGFAAPERSQGAAANTLSDVFSLGKLLIKLLEPFPKNAELSSILQKATQEMPAERYISADALVRDIARYKTGYTVQAYQAGSFYGLMKFVKRQAIGVSLGGLAFVALIGGLLSTSMLYKQAESARVESEKRFSEVRSIANFMLFDLYDELQPIPGNTRALEKITKKSKQYLEQLSALKADNFDLQFESIQGYNRLANITGNPFQYNLGLTGEASNIYDITQDRLEVLQKARPDDPRILRELANLFYDKASINYTSDEEAKNTFLFIERAQSYLSQLSEVETLSIKDERLRFSLISLRASTELHSDRGAEAVETFKAFESDVIDFFKAHPDNYEVKRQIADYYHIYAHTVSWHDYNLNKTDSSIPLYNKAIDHYLGMVSEKPNWLDARVKLALIYSRRAESHFALDDPDSAIADNNAASIILKDARHLDPEDQYVRRLYIINQGGIMSLSATQGRRDEVMAIAPDIIDLRRRDLINNPGDIGYIRLLANTLQLSGEAFFDVGEVEKGCIYILESVQRIKDYSAKKAFNELQTKNIVEPALEQAKRCDQ